MRDNPRMPYSGVSRQDENVPPFSISLSCIFMNLLEDHTVLGPLKQCFFPLCLWLAQFLWNFLVLFGQLPKIKFETIIAYGNFSVILRPHMILLFCCFMLFKLSKENKHWIAHISIWLYSSFNTIEKWIVKLLMFPFLSHWKFMFDFSPIRLFCKVIQKLRFWS